MNETYCDINWQTQLRIQSDWFCCVGDSVSPLLTFSLQYIISPCIHSGLFIMEAVYLHETLTSQYQQGNLIHGLPLKPSGNRVPIWDPVNSYSLIKTALWLSKRVQKYTVSLFYEILRAEIFSEKIIDCLTFSAHCLCNLS